MFIATIMSMVADLLIVFRICEHTKLNPLVTSLALQQIKGIDAADELDHVHNIYIIECTHKMQWYTMCILAIVSMLGIIGFILVKSRK